LVQEAQGLGAVWVKLAAEPYLLSGPTSARVAALDYNAELDEEFEPTRVLANGRGFSVGGIHSPRENVAFHQFNVWAIVNRTLALLEEPQLLGRPIRWASNLGRLLILPHAGYTAGPKVGRPVRVKKQIEELG
jgi:hypothetical protein